MGTDYAPGQELSTHDNTTGRAITHLDLLEIDGDKRNARNLCSHPRRMAYR